jgi:protein TonB
MGMLLEGDEKLDLELAKEPLAAPATGSLLLHGALAGGIVLWGFLGGFFHHNEWGSQGGGGSIQVNLVSSALPLPNDQPVNDNVLATEKPSQAPAPPAPKEKQMVDESALAIQGKQKSQPQQQKQIKSAQRQMTPQPMNRAQYGEQAGSQMQRSTMAQGGSNGPAAVGDGDFAKRFGWYVDGISRKMSTSWNKPEVDPRTPRGARAYLIFTIHRDGSANELQLDRSSGSPTLDRACMRGEQRIDSFDRLPSAYNLNTLKISFYCEY